MTRQLELGAGDRRATVRARIRAATREAITAEARLDLVMLAREDLLAAAVEYGDRAIQPDAEPSPDELQEAAVAFARASRLPVRS